MKKLLLIFGVAVFTLSTQAQEVRLGVKGGVNFASVGGDDLGDIKGRTGFHIGGLVEIPVSDKFSVQPELLYSAQGAKSEYSESFAEMGMNISVKATSKINLDYINIPIMAKYYVIDGLAIEAGPQIGFLMSAKAKGDVEITGDFPPELLDMFEGEFGSMDEDVKDQFSTVDFAVGLGASYRLDMGVFFGLRYNLGLSNINKEGDGKNQNNVFQISAGYSF